MTIATNFLLIILGVNLMVFVFGNPINNSPMLAFVKAIITTDVDWNYLIYTIGKNAMVYVALMGIVILTSYLSGSNPLTGGGGYASILTLQVIGIAVFSSLVLMPNFSTFGFPTMVEYIMDIVFGGFIAVTWISLLRNN